MVSPAFSLGQSACNVPKDLQMIFYPKSDELVVSLGFSIPIRWRTFVLLEIHR